MNKTYLYNIQCTTNFLYLFLGITPSLILSCQTNRTLLGVHNVCCQCPSHSLKPLLIWFFCIGCSKLFCLKSNSTVSLLGVTYFQKMLNCLVKQSLHRGSSPLTKHSCPHSLQQAGNSLSSYIGDTDLLLASSCDIISEVLDVTDGTLQFLHQQYHVQYTIHVRFATDLSRVIGRQINHLMWMILP